jgi:hypothetical protein
MEKVHVMIGVGGGAVERELESQRGVEIRWD